jgi:5S rRNA maturation endonuclease (ribonuclease M5)
MNDDRYVAMSPVDLCELIGQPYRKHGGYCTTSCYNASAHKHGDKNPSLTVYGFDRGYHCFGCGENGTNSWLLKQFGVRENSKTPVITGRTKYEKEEHPMEISTDEYCARLRAVWEKLPLLPQPARDVLEAKGFDAEAFERMPGLDPLGGWRWHTNQVKGWGEGIFIPYLQNGKMVTARLRRIADDGPRFLSMPGNSMYPYMIDLAMTNKRVMVCEGETDTLTLNFLGLPAVGIPGATSGTAINRLIEQAQCYATELVVVPDNDDAGERLAHRLLMAGYESKVAVSRAKVPLAKDVNEFFLQANSEQLNAFLERYELRQPVHITDSLETVRKVFGGLEALVG